MIKEIIEFNLKKEDIKKIIIFKNEFIKYNKNINLTSKNNIENFNLKNLRDSLGIIKFYDFNLFENVLDIGTGGGFPGIILAIIFKKTNFYLNDSNLKKITWIKKIKEILNLDNVFIINKRAEKLKNNYNEYFDVIVSRAVAKVIEIIEIGSPLLKKDGKIILYKGKNYLNELKLNENLIKEELGLNLNKINKWNLENDLIRFFIEYKKINNTKKNYPREYNNILNKKIFNLK